MEIIGETLDGLKICEFNHSLKLSAKTIIIISILTHNTLTDISMSNMVPHPVFISNSIPKISHCSANNWKKLLESNNSNQIKDLESKYVDYGPYSEEPRK